MDVGARDAKCVDADDHVVAEWRGFRWNSYRHCVPIDLGIGLDEIEVGGDDSVLARQHRFDRSQDSSGCFGVSDVRLDGSDVERVRLRPVAAQHVVEGTEFDGVPGLGPSSVGLDEGDGAWVDPGIGVGTFEHQSLARASRRHEQVTARSVVAASTACDHGMDRVAVCESVGKRPQKQDTDPFASHKSVSVGVTELAAVVGGEHARVGERPALPWPEYQVHTGRDRGGTLAVPEAATGHVDRAERRSACRIYGQCRAIEVEDVRHATCHGRTCAAAHNAVHVGIGAVSALPVVRGVGTDEYPGIGSLPLLSWVARVLERLPHTFEKKTLLRVHRLGFPG
ncbi:hypothetical protein RhoFasGS6_04598 [Rhodococcus fascians]|nr:hypothetical protein [Rhodococcus fascians]